MLISGGDITTKNIRGQPPWIKAHVGLPRAGKHATDVMMVKSRVCITYLNPQGSLYPWFMATSCEKPLTDRHVKLLSPSGVLKNQMKTWIFWTTRSLVASMFILENAITLLHLLTLWHAARHGKLYRWGSSEHRKAICAMYWGGVLIKLPCKTGHPLFLSGSVGSKFLF